MRLDRLLLVAVGGIGIYVGLQIAGLRRDLLAVKPKIDQVAKTAKQAEATVAKASGVAGEVSAFLRKLG